MPGSKDDASASEYQILFEHAADGVFVADAQGRYVDANARGLEMLGYSLEELRELRLWDLLGDGEPDPPLQIDALQRGRMIRRERTLRRKDGSTFTAEISGTSLPDGRLLGLVRDVSDRKSMEQQLRDSEERYRSLVEGANVGILVFQDGRIAFVNELFAEQIGYGPDALLALAPEQVVGLVHPDDRGFVFDRIRKRLAGEEVPTRYEFRIVTRTDEVRWFDVSSNLVNHQGRPGLQATTIDITERKLAEERLARTQKLDALGRLAGGIAHDFNNILAVIMAEAGIARRAPGAAGDIAGHLEEIEASAARAAELTQQLLSFSRHRLAQPSVFSLADVIRAASRMLRRVIGENIELAVDLAPDTGAIVADRGQIEQLLVNLAVNARDAMPRGGTLSIATRPRNVEPGERDLPPGWYAEIIVADTGVGMSEEVKARLFEPFFSTKERGEGTGLGLATCYGIVKRYAGDIRVDSQLGRGATFEILLPRGTGQATQPEPAAEPGPGRKGNETILMVEDEEMLRRALSMVLRDQGYEVVAAATAEEALRQLDEVTSDVSLLLTDMVLPGMSGAALAERFLERRPETRVLIMSGYSEEGLHVAHREGTRISTIQKPFTPEGLAARVREALD